MTFTVTLTVSAVQGDGHHRAVSQADSHSLLGGSNDRDCDHEALLNAEVTWMASTGAEVLVALEALLSILRKFRFQDP